LNGENTAEILLSNMDFAGVNCAVVTQELIDGPQDEYLLEVGKKYPDRLMVSCLYTEEGVPDLSGFSPDQQTILRALEAGPMQLDELIHRTGLPAARILPQLTLLQMKKTVACQPGKRYSILKP
jgi:predicted Rossmann fold nucleotide-binding protein DprA/Smf involved in DNA uptake